MALAPADSLFDDILDFLASTPTPQQIVDFAPPVELQERLRDLIDRNRLDQLSFDERSGLDEFLRLNRFMSRLRLKARQKLS